MRLQLVFLATLLLFASACSAGSAPEAAPSAKCPVTKPNGATPPGERSSDSYHGNGVLWTGLYYPKLVATARNLRRDGSIAEKFWWWADIEVRGLSLTEGMGLRITGRRLDGAAPRLRAEIPCCYSPGFQASAIVFPSAGCWEVTGRATAAVDAEAATLTFVTLVVREPTN